MIWLTRRQHRGAFMAGLAAVAGICVLALIAGLPMHLAASAALAALTLRRVRRRTA